MEAKRVGRALNKVVVIIALHIKGVKEGACGGFFKGIIFFKHTPHL